VVAALTKLKTGSLFSLACTVSPIALGASHDVVRALGDFGRDAGVAFQILDDLAELSRGRGEDLRGARPTWPWVFAARRTSEPSRA
jgi:geranylgeranyl pyrophosphate synthase